MSYERFFNNCFESIKKKHRELINTPKARVSQSLKDEIKEVLENLDYYHKYGDISEEFYKSIKKRIKEIDFENIAKLRAMRKYRADK